jgi:hypothetical protein
MFMSEGGRLLACHALPCQCCAPADAAVPPLCSAAAEDKASGRKVTAATCTSSKVMGLLAQLLQTPYRADGGGGKVGCRQGSKLGQAAMAGMQCRGAVPFPPPSPCLHALLLPS